MAGDTTVTIVGNLAGDVELRFTPSGRAVANFRVGTTPRSFNKDANEWRDGETWWLSCSVWGDYANNVAESLEKGARVVVTGRLVSRSYEDREGVKRYTVELQADEVAPSLRFASAKVTKTGRPQLRAVSGGDPWAAPPADGEPPF